MNRLKSTTHLNETQKRLYLSAVGQVLRLAETMPHQTAPWHRDETARERPARRAA
jgi:hypothetical protein